MIEKLINEHLAAERAKPRESSGRFHVSDAGRCRLMRYKKRQATAAHADFDERAYRIFAVGHLFHRWIQDVLEQRGVLEGAEIPVGDEHRSGLIDAIVKEDGKRILYDFKTVHSKKFMWLTSEADMHYHYQAATYSILVENPPDEIRIAYVSKDDLLIKEVPVFLTPDKVKADWDPLIEAWVKQEPPAPNPLKWEGLYCLYASECVAAKDGRCNTENTKAKKEK